MKSPSLRHTAHEQAKSRLTRLNALTEKETLQLDRFREGMDFPNCGWLDQMEVSEGKALSGIVSSLVKKGAIISIIDDESFWIEVADEWQI